MSANGVVAVPSPAVEGPFATGRTLRPVVLAALTVALVALCLYLGSPFLPAVTWALALAVIAWPLHERIARHIRRPGLAAGLTSIVVTLFVLGPLSFVAYQLAREAASAADRMKAEPTAGTVRETMEKAPGLRGVIVWADRVGMDVDAEARKLVSSYTQDAGKLIEGSAGAIAQTAVALFVLFHLFRDRGPLLSAVRRLLPLARDEADHVFTRVADSVYANLYATLVTSLIDAVGGGLMFWLLGLPSPILWGVIMFILSILPVVGTFIVWMPAAAYLIAAGEWPKGLALVAWGLAGWVVVDNYVYVWVAGNRMQLHQVPALIAFLGGLALFGTAGMILGPAVLAVTVGLLEVWHRRVAAHAHSGLPAAGIGFASPTPP
jgi:predicted PurR-regulated permease PerM